MPPVKPYIMRYRKEIKIIRASSTKDLEGRVNEWLKKNSSTIKDERYIFKDNLIVYITFNRWTNKPDNKS